MGLFVGKELPNNEYRPGAIMRWLWPKHLSGNESNGYGVKEKVPPTQMLDGPNKKYWVAPGLWFLVRCYVGNMETLKSFFIYMKREKSGHIDVAPQKIEESGEKTAAALREYAKDHPQIDILGITHMRDEWMFVGQKPPRGKWIIVIAKAMDYEKVAANLKGNFNPTLTQVIGGYERTQKAAVDIANWIRARGYDAKGFGGMAPVKDEWHLVIPAAIESGIGQLAKNGSIISDKLGSCFRLASVITEIPLAADSPREIGVDEFCYACKKCQTDCPAGAITNEKHLVRGVMKWYVNFDKCMPYMAEHKACAICLSTCPWSRPGVAPSLSKKMLAKMARNKDDA
ncbi:MAG: hypothetical protein CMF31_01815 [Kordiimonas sp.]|nr:hypothetical protein [Kordiimonas sp.]